MNTTKYEIELPTLPDGLELDGYGKPKVDGMCLSNGVWMSSHDGPIDACANYILARRRETLAGWANKQRLFQALAEMRAQMGSTVISHHIGKAWDWGGSLMVIAEPPANLTGKLRLEVGKWVDVS